MKVILLEDIDRLGQAGTVVKVKDGFARNHLIPKNLAEKATAQSLQRVAEIERKRQAKQAQIKAEAQDRAEKLANLSCTITVKAGPDDKLFGSVTSQDIAHVFAQEGFSIDKKDIVLDEPIKELGVYTLTVKVHPEVSTEVKVWVVKE